MSRYLMTQSLLSDWKYIYDAYDGEAAFEAFRNTLRRESKETSVAASCGIAFENDVAAICADPAHQSKFQSAYEVANIVWGGQFQVKQSKKVRIAGMDFLLYGKLDVLRAGTVYDIKYTGSYEAGKYYGSPQHPMYFALVPEARQFVYVITDGEYVYQERYTPAETTSVEGIVTEFMSFLEGTRLMDEYRKNWVCKYG